MSRDIVGFISYARADGEEFAASLIKKLQASEPEITLWQDREQMEGGVDFESQLRQAIDEVNYLVLVLTPAAMRSKWVEKEWRYAREQGVCVCPVLGAPEAELSGPRQEMPRWMSQAHAYDLDKEWTRFVNVLKSPCQATRVPFMAADLPDNYVERTSELQKILDQALDEGLKNPSGRNVALYGSGGFGKTTLAVRLCHDGDVVAACDGGILWTTLGQQPSLLAELTKLYAALTGERPAFVDADDASIELSKVLADKRCLLVIDDVWEVEHLKPFLRGDDQCTRLITTRNVKVAAEAADVPGRISIGELNPAEAAQLLVSRLTPPPTGLRPFRALAKRLGEWPMLLELANSTLVEQIALGETVAGALAWMNQALDRMNVVAFDREDAVARNQAIAKTVEVSLSLLKDKRHNCLELAIFPEDADVPLSLAGMLWNTDEFETRRLAQRMHELSILKVDLPNHTLRLHDAMRAYLATQLGDAAKQLHGKLCDTWKNPAHVTGDYALHHAGYHLVEAMSDPEQTQTRGFQLLALLGDPRLRDYVQKHADLVTLNRQLDRAIALAAKSAHPQSPTLLAGLCLSLASFAVERLPNWLFELARGNPGDAVERLDLFDAAPEWKTAARLAIAWIASRLKPDDSNSLADDAAPMCNLPELRKLLAWVRQAPDGIPPDLAEGVQKTEGEPDLVQISRILERAGGAEGTVGIEPLYTGSGISGMAEGGPAFIAEADGPPLVAFARQNPKVNTAYLRQYIAIHAANRYRYYRNRSLWALLKPVLEYPEAAWVRSILEDLIRSALTVTPINFRESVPLALHALRARWGDGAAAQKLEEYRQGFLREAGQLSPERGKGDSWSHYHRRASFLAEVYAVAMSQPDEAAKLLKLARELAKGFAGFRAPSALTLAEASRVALPGDREAVDAALLSAQAASHRIQDYPFCLQTTAMVNAMRGRWWPPAGLDAAGAIERLAGDPGAPEFCILHRVGEKFEFRDPGPHTLPIPPDVLGANTLRALARVYRRSPEALLDANPGWELDDSLPAGTEVGIPDPEFIPLLAARLAAEAMGTANATLMIQSLAPLAAANATALDTVLARLLLSTVGTRIELPTALAAIDLTLSTPEASAAAHVIA
jgi:TIR domain-containing protein/NB-ARC domain-containing protein